MPNPEKSFNGGEHYEDEGSLGNLKNVEFAGDQQIEESSAEAPTKAHQELPLFTKLPGGFTVASGAYEDKSTAYDELRKWGSDIEGYTVYPYDNGDKTEYYIVTRGN